jgi:hypothetical protein
VGALRHPAIGFSLRHMLS